MPLTSERAMVAASEACEPLSRVGAISAPELGPVDRLGSGVPLPGYASCPWQCLYFLPDPHGQGALRLTGASTTPPWASRCGNGCCGIVLSGGRFESTAPVAAS